MSSDFVPRQLLKAEEIVQGRWEEVFRYIGLGDYLQYERKEGPCPICGGNTRFRFMDLHDSGKHFCAHCSDLKNGVGFGFRLVMRYRECTFKEAARLVRQALGVESSSGAVVPNAKLPPPKAARKQASSEELEAKYKRLWENGFEITATDAAGLYLARRAPGLKRFPKTLRFHPGLDYYEERTINGSATKEYVKLGTFPGMVGYVQAPNGDMANIWRWFLTKDGQKANVPEPKKSAGRWLHPSGSLRLGEPTDGLLGTCEGMEGGLRVMVMHGITMWPSMNAGMLEKFEVPKGLGIQRVYVYGDRDEPKNFSEVNPNGVRRGDVAAKKLVASLKAAGMPAFLRMPASTKYDFGDIGLPA